MDFFGNLDKFSLQKFYDIFNQFLSYFPEQYHGAVSIALAIILVVGIYKVIRKQLIYLIVLIVLLPAAGPILKNVWEQVMEVLKFLLTKR